MDVLELEHCIGWTGGFPFTLLCRPGASSDSAILLALGSDVVLADATDPHKQEFLRGHDAPVSAIAVSRSGRLIASGQIRSPVSAVSSSLPTEMGHGARRCR
jgi:hypothetical protein